MRQFGVEPISNSLLAGDQIIPPAILNEADELNFRKTMQVYSSKLFAIVYGITKNSAVAEDIVQESFLKLWTKRSSIVLKDTGSWLGKVAMNMAYNHLKQEGVKAKTFATLSYRKSGEYFPNAEETLIGKENEAKLRKAFTLLPPQQKIVYKLSKTNDLSRNEIAQYLNISPHTVKYHLTKAVQFLRENIGIVSMVLLFLLMQIIFSESTSTNSSLDCLINKELKVVMKEKYASLIAPSASNKI